MDNVPSSSPITTTQLGANDSQTVIPPILRRYSRRAQQRASTRSKTRMTKKMQKQKQAEAEAEEGGEGEEEEEENKDDERRRATTNIFFFFLRSTLGQGHVDLVGKRQKGRVGSPSRGPRWLQPRADIRRTKKSTRQAECHSTSSRRT
ncbi:hypothetical protein V1478_011199, partial [Vespula squamosa]